MQAVQRLCEAGHDPLALMCDGGHQAGLDVFLRLRMNDHHDRWGDRIGLDKPSRLPKDHPAEPYFYTPKWKREHPEWLIGDRHASYPDTSFEYMQASAGNYAIGPYRDLIFNLAAETLTQYDLDGFELDFFRSPFLFPSYEAYVQRHVMTELIRRIRRVADEQAAKRGRPIFLSARVPATVDLCLRIGIDLPVWFQEGLLDMVVVSNGLSPFSTPWKELVPTWEPNTAFRPLPASPTPGPPGKVGNRCGPAPTVPFPPGLAESSSGTISTACLTTTGPAKTPWT